MSWRTQTPSWNGRTRNSTRPTASSARYFAAWAAPEEAESREFLSLDTGLPAVDVGPWLRRVLAEADGGGTSTGPGDRVGPQRQDGGASGGRLFDAHRRGC